MRNNISPGGTWKLPFTIGVFETEFNKNMEGPVNKVESFFYIRVVRHAISGSVLILSNFQNEKNYFPLAA